MGAAVDTVVNTVVEGHDMGAAVAAAAGAARVARAARKVDGMGAPDARTAPCRK